MPTRDVGTQTPNLYIIGREVEQLLFRGREIGKELSEIQTKLVGLDDQIATGLRQLREAIDKKLSEFETKLNNKADVGSTHSRDFGTIGRLDTRVSALERSIWSRHGWR